MALPDGFLDELRDRLSMAQVAGRKVTWDSRKSNPGKGDYWAPCPFHQEKSPSFHVDDRKGYYYCFGCQAKGNVYRFVQDTENVSFMEAVEILAAEAGMQLPERDPREVQAADLRGRLAEVMEQAVQFYRLQLNARVAEEARSYLARRGLDQGVIDRFEIGHAPAGRTALLDALSAKGVKSEEMVAAGVVIAPDDGSAPFDRFRGRIMFPIRNPRGQAIAFGGRSLDPNARAKYLNSNETILFDKGRALYNFGPAREAAGKAGALIVVEGYMDVVALVRAGIDHAVAPLGTAVTEQQLALLWRAADEPIVALDGDKAGVKAAMRLMDLALPNLQPGKSLRFCLLPDGQDPDDVIRKGGGRAMTALLDKAISMVELLWRRETDGQLLDSPERRAALDHRLRGTLAKIADQGLRAHYEADLRQRRRDLYAPKPRSGAAARRKRGAGFKLPAQAVATTRASALAQDQAGTGFRTRERMILAACLYHPPLAEELEAELEALPLTDRDCVEVRDALLSCLDEPDASLRQQAMHRRLGADPADMLGLSLRAAAFMTVAPNRPQPAVRAAIEEEIGKQRAEIGLATELQDAERTLLENPDDSTIWRLSEAVTQRDRRLTAPLDDALGEEVTLKNGVRVPRSERDAFAEALRKFDTSKPEEPNR